MSGTAGTKRGIMAASMALLMVVGVLAAFAGSASAAPLPSAGSATVSWAYGGSNATNGTFTSGAYTVTWSASIGTDVVFNATPTGPTTTELEAQRTVGVTISITLTAPKGTVAFEFHAWEAGTAFANLTNASAVDVAGTMVPALGIDNSSFHGTAGLAESLVAKGVHGSSASAYLNVSAKADAQVGFSPALGIVPLNLDGVSAWNSTANATPSASWNVSYNYAFHGWNNSSASGHGARTGDWTAAGPVNLTGEVISLGLPHFRDHAPRVGILLMVAGPANIYDGFVVIPRGFDIFSGAPHDFNSESMSNVTISGESLYLTPGHVRAGSLTASRLVVGGAAGSQPLVASTTKVAATPAAGGIGGSVVAQPETVSAAQSQAHCLQFGCTSAGPWFSGLVAVALIAGLIAAVAGTVGVVEYRAYARRKNRSTSLVGGYGESLAGGLPPVAAQPPTSPQAVPNGPVNDLGPGRQN